MKVAATISASFSHLGLRQLSGRAGSRGRGKGGGRAGEEGSNGELHLEVCIGSLRSNSEGA